MNDRSWKLCWILTGIGILTGLLDRAYALGFLLGGAVSILLYRHNESFWTEILHQGKTGRWTGMGTFAIHYAIMAAVLILCAKLPGIFNIFACALGLLIIKFSILLDAAIGRKKEQ